MVLVFFCWAIFSRVPKSILTRDARTCKLHLHFSFKKKIILAVSVPSLELSYFQIGSFQKTSMPPPWRELKVNPLPLLDVLIHLVFSETNFSAMGVGRGGV